MDSKLSSKMQRVRKTLSRIHLRESFRKKLSKIQTIQRPRPERPKPIVIVDSDSNTSSESSMQDTDSIDSGKMICKSKTDLLFLKEFSDFFYCI